MDQDCISLLENFDVICKQGKLLLLAESNFPDEASTYLKQYLEKASQYKNVAEADNPVFSLYQPALLSLAGKRWLTARLRRKFQRARIPATATIGISKHCQCSCQHCSASYHMETKAGDLSAEQLGQAVRETIALGATTIIFLGGEPLLRKDLYDIIQSANDGRADFILFTNGELLTEDRASQLKAAGLRGCFVSLDSPVSQEHDALRKRPGLFAKATAGIKVALDCGLLVGISTYLTDERLEQNYLDQFMELGRQSGATEVTFFDAIAVGRMQNGQSSFLTDAARRQIAEKTRLYRKRLDYPAISAQSELTSEQGSAFCFAGHTQFYLSSTGQFCPCDFTPISAGQFPEQSIAELWKTLTAHPLYARPARACRMQDVKFREHTIDTLKPGSSLPAPLSGF